ncbi:hypothetical protein KJ980_04625 [Patescibacteria group bacterium]|nr:hypothetical protein [Patescibacteria group bacterium]MBU4098908.1 hypothetical protein [Patescibacteria group bacterium]
MKTKKSIKILKEENEYKKIEKIIKKSFNSAQEYIKNTKKPTKLDKLILAH